MKNNKKSIEVSAAVIRYKNKIFCVQRKNEGPLAKKWEFPGGKLEKGETPKEALHRELIEELNLDLDINEYIMTVDYEYPSFFIKMHAFYCDVQSSLITLNEHLDSKWLLLEQLNTLDWADADLPIVNRIKGVK